MPVEIALNTPLAEALTSAIQPKLVEVGWGTGGADDSALAEYIILMLVNGKTQEEIAAELAGDLLSLGPDDPNALEFAKWLFEQITILSGSGAQSGEADQMTSTSPGDDQDTDMAMASEGVAQVSAPTGPKAMRNGNMNIRGNANRDRRMMGQINRAMDRTQDGVLHRTRGNDRINSHARGPPSGPRGSMAGGMRQQRGAMNPRAASIAHGLATMGGGMPPGGPGMNGGMSGMNNGWMPPQGQDLQIGLFQMLEQQNQMMAHLQQQLNQQSMMQQRGGFNQRGGRGGKPLSERVQHQNRHNSNNNNTNNSNFRQGQTDQNGGEQKPSENSQDGSAGGEDTEMGQAKRDPKETVCKFNRNCSNKDCKFAHQSPAAAPGVTVDVSDLCTYGAACKNHKCVGSHPSPATRTAHNQQQDCKFYPNCTNPHCTFRHPNMPPCRNGGDCSVEGCKFTHVKTMCKFRPCTNRYCAFKHEEGQRGTFQDKVWVAGGEHVSERRFADESGPVEDILQGSGGDSEMGATEAEAVIS